MYVLMALYEQRMQFITYFSRERSLDLFRRREVERDLLRRRRSRESSEELDEELL